LKRLALILPLVLLLAPGCKSSGGATPQPVAEKKPSPEELQAERAKKLVEQARLMAGAPATGAAEPEETTDWSIVTDEATGRKLQRIPKDQTLRVVNGKVVSALLNPKITGLDLVRQDAGYYYVAVPESPKPEEAGPHRPDVPLVPVLAPGEYEAVSPSPSSVRLRLEEHSGGLPTSGYWRSNLAMADLDGDGKPEIVTTPPRLASGPARVFRYDGTGWGPVQATFEGDDTLVFAYGGVAVQDLNADGRPDIVSVGHGSGPFLSFGEGAFRFRKEDRGLPREMTSRVVAVGDLDGDGRPDLLAVSDQSESADVLKEQEKESRRGGAKSAGAKSPGGYDRGLNIRAFFSGPDGRFAQNSTGLESACWGYSLALNASPVDGGAPFFVSGCRTMGGTGLLYEFDRATKSFRYSGREAVERYSYHSGAAAMTYRGKPGAASSYVKVDGRGAGEKSIRGNGLSIYYRDGGAWKRKRVVKAVGAPTIESAGLGTGDLNGDGLDDIVWADDSVGRVRVLFQTPGGEFEELDPALEPRYVNHSMAVSVVDVDRDGRNDIVLMYEFRSTDKSRAGGLRFFRNAG
jgi:hypothetical protein